MLEARGIHADYGQGDVVFGVDFSVDDGELVVLLGPNGAGKSTLLKVLAGVVPARRGRLRLDGIDVGGASAAQLARCGLYLVQEGRAVFRSLTVAENLRVASARPERSCEEALSRVYEQFPVLAQRRRQVAGTLSGGEQQMLALARAYVAQPVVLLLDEPSLGLAPKIVDEVFAVIREFRSQGIAIVLVEQYVHRALEVADRVYMMTKGQLASLGPASSVSATELEQHYLGIAAP